MRRVGLIVAMAACGRLQFDARGDAAIDVAADVAVDAPFATGPFGQATQIDVLGQAEDCTLTGDMLELFFVSARSGTEDVWVVTRATVGDAFGPPSLVQGVNTSATEATPEVSRDGLTLWVASDRAGSLGMDVWITRRATRTSPWMAPVLVPELNSPQLDYPAAIDGPELEVIVQSDRAGNTDLFFATRSDSGATWSTPASLAALNSTSTEFNAALDARARVLLFGSNRAGGQGSLDLYIATRPDRMSAWSPPQGVAELNTAFEDGDPWISDDGHDIFFASDRMGLQTLYHASR
jgi:hypothetical protein